LGPVVRYELITTARRGRFYLVRVVYGLLLLIQLGILFRLWESNHPGGGTLPEIHEFAEDAFIQFAGTQGLALLCVIPALVAGVIADEHQRKTLHYLLASRLSSAEIVIGKLGARLVHVGTFVALGFPVVSLLLLYGGINPVNVFYVYFGTFTLVLFLAGVSILISTLARRPRDAILAAYGLGAFWLLVPIAIEPYAHHLNPPLGWVEPVNEWLIASNPIVVWSQATNIIHDWKLGRVRPVFFVGQFEEVFYWMAGIQSAVGLSFLVLAIVGLRPLRGTSWPGGKPQVGWWSRLSARFEALVNSRKAAPLVRNELLASRSIRTSCGDDPMLWKERHIRLSGGLKWLRSRPVALFLSVLLGCFLLDAVYPVLESLFTGRQLDRSWAALTDALRASTVVLTLIATLPIAAAAATSLTGEREQDTWTSLATTMLTPGEIIRAKQFGAVWSARWVGLALLVLWSAGLLLGALHPLGVLAAALIVAINAWLTAALGLAASSRARNSIRALAVTYIAAFIFGFASGWLPMLWTSLASYRDFASWLSSAGPRLDNGRASPFAGVQLYLGLMALYVWIAALISYWTIRRLRATWGNA
jgi:ABC-type transport system involved in multi-copper enzyme maturation permease subunit